MTTETKINSIISRAKIDVVSVVLTDAAQLIADLKTIRLTEDNFKGWKIDIEYDHEYYLEVSTRLIRKLAMCRKEGSLNDDSN